MIRIEVYSDVVCPWCYVGERRLERALRARPDVEAEVIWRPFRLNPGVPEGGMPYEELSRRKFGGEQNRRGMFAYLTRVGEAEGIEFRFDRIRRAPDTTDAHRLILRAGREGRQWAVADALMRAYFTEGRDVGDRATLAEVAGEAGMETAEILAYLEGGRDAEAVWRSQLESYTAGVGGVPHYVFDGARHLSGAQPPEVFEGVIDAVTGASGTL